MNLCALCIFTFFVGAGCSSTSATTMGTAGGGVAGAGIGVALGSPGLGAIVGMGLGALGGGIAQDHLDKKQAEKEKKELEAQLEATSPPTPLPEKNFIKGQYELIIKKRWVDTSRKEQVWIEERLEEGRHIEGHYEEKLVPSGYWEEYKEKVWVPDHYE